jgi:hypothetical protein
VEMCNAITCQGSTSHRAGAEQIYCDQMGHDGHEMLECSGKDQQKCCSENGMCSTYPCSGDTLHIHNSHEVECDGRDCANTPSTKCCVALGSCPSYHCPQAFGPKNDSSWENQTCINDVCGDEDKYTCCVKRGACGLYWCDTGYVWRPNIEHLRCAGAVCDPVTDLLSCCEPAPAAGSSGSSGSGDDGVTTTTDSAGETTSTIGSASDDSLDNSEDDTVQNGACRGYVGAFGSLWRSAESLLVLGGFLAVLPISIYGLQE